jgi:hypothetical protein
MTAIYVEVSYSFSKLSHGAKTYDTIPKPVRGGGQANTTRTDWKWKDFTDDDPGTWTPSCCEKEDIDANESNHSLDSVRVLSVGHTYHMKLDSCFLEKKY